MGDSGKRGEATCPICICPYDSTTSMSVLTTCGHPYHTDCIKQWRQKCATKGSRRAPCPQCKKLFEDGDVLRVYLNLSSDGGAGASADVIELDGDEDGGAAEEPTVQVQRLQDKLDALKTHIRNVETQLQCKEDELRTAHADIALRVDEAVLAAEAQSRQRIAEFQGTLARTRRERDEFEGRLDKALQREHAQKQRTEQLAGQIRILQAGLPTAVPGSDFQAVAAAMDQLKRGIDPASIVQMLGTILQNKDRQLQQARGELHDAQRRMKEETKDIREECNGRIAAMEAQLAHLQSSAAASTSGGAHGDAQGRGGSRSPQRQQQQQQCGQGAEGGRRGTSRHGEGAAAAPADSGGGSRGGSDTQLRKRKAEARRQDAKALQAALNDIPIPLPLASGPKLKVNVSAKNGDMRAGAGIGQLAMQTAFLPRGGLRGQPSGTFIKHGADGRGGRTTVLASIDKNVPDKRDVPRGGGGAAGAQATGREKEGASLSRRPATAPQQGAAAGAGGGAAAGVRTLDAFVKPGAGAPAHRHQPAPQQPSRAAQPPPAAPAAKKPRPGTLESMFGRSTSAAPGGAGAVAAAAGGGGGRASGGAAHASSRGLQMEHYFSRGQPQQQEQAQSLRGGAGASGGPSAEPQGRGGGSFEDPAAQQQGDPDQWWDDYDTGCVHYGGPEEEECWPEGQGGGGGGYGCHPGGEQEEEVAGGADGDDGAAASSQEY